MAGFGTFLTYLFFFAIGRRKDEADVLKIFLILSVNVQIIYIYIYIRGGSRICKRGGGGGGG